MTGRAPARWPRLVLALLALSTVINYLDRQALAVLLPVLRHDLALTASDYGRMASLFLLAYTVALWAWGLAVDWIGPRRGFAISVGIWSIAAMAHALCRSVLGFGVARFVLGLGEAGNWPAGGKVVAETFPRERQALAMGIFDGGSGVGAILAPPLIAALALRFGWRSAFVASGALGLIWLAAWLVVCPRGERKPAGGMPPRARLRLPDLADRGLWGLMGTRLLATPIWYFYVFWLPDYLTKERHFTLKDIGLFGWIPYVAVDLGKLVGGAVSDALVSRGWPAIQARKVVMGGGAVFMLAALRVHAVPDAAGALTWISVATFGFGIWSANILALHSDLFAPQKIGAALGFTGMAASLGGAASAYLIGRIVDGSGYGPVFATASLIAFVALLCLCLTVPRTLEFKPQTESTP